MDCLLSVFLEVNLPFISCSFHQVKYSVCATLLKNRN